MDRDRIPVTFISCNAFDIFGDVKYPICIALNQITSFYPYQHDNSMTYVRCTDGSSILVDKAYNDIYTSDIGGTT